jgi:non-ribosomal peptide synthetase component E (peptide arylation enzyme)
MDPIEKRELKRKAWIRLAAQRRRAGMLRGRVVVISLICFVALWGVVFAQMATGNDPVLGGKKSAVTTRTVASTSPTKEIETSDPREFETAEVEAAEIAEVEAAELEEAEVEPLVTSQS